MKIQIADFQVWFYAFYFEVRNSRVRGGRASELCDKIALPLAEFSRGHRSEGSLRQELTHAIRPFVGQAESAIGKAQELSWGTAIRKPLSLSGFALV
jgi:hypothetical protein